MQTVKKQLSAVAQKLWPLFPPFPHDGRVLIKYLPLSIIKSTDVITLMQRFMH